jgi:ADP-ribosylglycohydrolase
MDIINNESWNIQDLIYYYYCIWRCSGPKDIGNATSTALRFWNQKNSIHETKFNYDLVKYANWGSLANGFLMRISTFITYYYYSHLDNIYNVIQNYNFEEKDLTDDMVKLYYDIYIESSKNTEITHPNYENGISSAVFSLLVFISMVTKDANKAYSLFKKIASSQKFLNVHEGKYVLYMAKQAQNKYLKIIQEVESDKLQPVYSQMGYYIHGFKLSIYYLKKIGEMGKTIEDDYYYKIMCDVCDFGGDTDTNCAIVGAMVGPLIGYKNFNDKYFDRFIRFVPEDRCQFNSAFMYIYVNCLEEKFLKQKKQEKEEKTQNNSNIEEKSTKDEKKDETCEKKDEKKENKEVEKIDVEENNNDSKGNSHEKE